MGPALATALAVLTQLVASQEPFRPSVRVQFVPIQKTAPAPMGFMGDVIVQPRPVSCTMPMLRPSTDVDPKIVVTPPENDAKIRTLDAGKCIERVTR